MISWVCFFSNSQSMQAGIWIRDLQIQMQPLHQLSYSIFCNCFFSFPDFACHFWGERSWWFLQFESFSWTWTQARRCRPIHLSGEKQFNWYTVTCNYSGQHLQLVSECLLGVSIRAKLLHWLMKNHILILGQSSLSRKRFKRLDGQSKLTQQHHNVLAKYESCNITPIKHFRELTKSMSHAVTCTACKALRRMYLCMPMRQPSLRGYSE